MLKSLGMDEDEVIETKMVARQIKAAQQKLAKQCQTDFPAESAEKWMEREPFRGAAQGLSLKNRLNHVRFVASTAILQNSDQV